MFDDDDDFDDENPFSDDDDSQVPLTEQELTEVFEQVRPKLNEQNRKEFGSDYRDLPSLTNKNWRKAKFLPTGLEGKAIVVRDDACWFIGYTHGGLMVAAFTLELVEFIKESTDESSQCESSGSD